MSEIAAENAPPAPAAPAADAMPETPSPAATLPLAAPAPVAGEESLAAAAGDGTGTAPAESTETVFFRRARSKRTPLEGRVIGWNKGGFHVLVNGTTAFCPRSEMELGEPADPESYVDQPFPFQVLRVEDGGRRIVLSRAAALRAERARQAKELTGKLEVGAVVHGTVASLTEFGAFVDLGGLRGLVHVSEISHEPVRKPEDKLQLGQPVDVKVIKLQNGGKRISLSIKALAPDPWAGIAARYGEGTQVMGVVERTNRFGAFVRLEGGVTGLLPASEMGLPRDASAARAFPPGKEVSLQVLSVDARQRRITLAPEGTQVEGTKADLKAYLRRQQTETRPGFNALAAAFRKLR